MALYRPATGPWQAGLSPSMNGDKKASGAQRPGSAFRTNDHGKGEQKSHAGLLRSKSGRVKRSVRPIKNRHCSIGACVVLLLFAFVVTLFCTNYVVDAIRYITGERGSSRLPDLIDKKDHQQWYDAISRNGGSSVEVAKEQENTDLGGNWDLDALSDTEGGSLGRHIENDSVKASAFDKTDANLHHRDDLLLPDLTYHNKNNIRREQQGDLDGDDSFGRLSSGISAKILERRGRQEEDLSEREQESSKNTGLYNERGRKELRIYEEQFEAALKKELNSSKDQTRVKEGQSRNSARRDDLDFVKHEVEAQNFDEHISLDSVIDKNELKQRGDDEDNGTLSVVKDLIEKEKDSDNLDEDEYDDEGDDGELARATNSDNEGGEEEGQDETGKVRWSEEDVDDQDSEGGIKGNNDGKLMTSLEEKIDSFHGENQGDSSRIADSSRFSRDKKPQSRKLPVTKSTTTKKNGKTVTDGKLHERDTDSGSFKAQVDENTQAQKSSKLQRRRKHAAVPCEISFLNTTKGLKEPTDYSEFGNFSLSYISREDRPEEGIQWDPQFAGHQTIHEREESFKAIDQTLHCGFIEGPEGSPWTGFELSQVDTEYLETCHIAVSSCIFGNYDHIRNPLSKKVSSSSKKKVCFAMFVDQKSLDGMMEDGEIPDQNGNLGLWHIVLVKNMPYADGRRTGKVPKFLTHRLFPNARYSVWLDSKLRLQNDPLLILEYFLWRGGHEYAISNHYDRHCVWEEVAQNKRLNKFNHSIIDEQFSFYRADGLTKFNASDPTKILPSHVPEGSFIVRAHTPMSNLFSCLWFNEVNRFTPRDQLSFAYTYLKFVRMNPSQHFYLNMFKDCERKAMAKLYRHKQEEVGRG